MIHFIFLGFIQTININLTLFDKPQNGGTDRAMGKISGRKFMSTFIILENAPI